MECFKFRREKSDETIDDHIECQNPCRDSFELSELARPARLEAAEAAASDAASAAMADMVRAHPLPRQPRQQHTFNSTRLLLSMLLTIDSHKCLGAVVNNAPTLHGW